MLGNAMALPWTVQAAIGFLVTAIAVWAAIRYRDRSLLFATAVWGIEVGLLIGARGLLLGVPIAAPFGVKTYTYVLVPMAAGAIILSRRHWWTSAGFTAPSQWQRLRLLWLVALFFILPAFALVHGVRWPWNLTLLLAGYVLLGTGLEEMFYRGIVLRATIAGGVLPAVLFTSLLFGASHVAGLATYPSIGVAYVGLQAWIGFLLGIFLAAIRLRMNAIWPAWAVHAGYDLPTILIYGPYAFRLQPTLTGAVESTVIGLILAGIGLFLLRHAKPSILRFES